MRFLHSTMVLKRGLESPKSQSLSSQFELIKMFLGF
jgi:hypothetical protein